MKTTFEMKNTLDEINVRLYMAKEKITEPTAIAIETSQNETEKKRVRKKERKKLKETKRVSLSYGITSNNLM